jgi:hypothetical protein
MTKYLISFPDGAMTFPEVDLPDVAEAAHAIIQEAKDAGVYVFGGGLDFAVKPVRVAEDGTVTNDTYPQTKDLGGGYTIIEVPTRLEALEWARKIAFACRCAQELREFMYDPMS